MIAQAGSHCQLLLVQQKDNTDAHFSQTDRLMDDDATQALLGESK